MTPFEVEARLAKRPGQATVRALLAAMEGDLEWSTVSATAGGRIVWAEFTHLPSRTVLTLAPEELREHEDDRSPSGEGT
jgi:hypothetical protein